MNRLSKWAQAQLQSADGELHRQSALNSPRKQLQWAALFLLGLIIVALVSSVYLNVSARAAQVGREVQVMQQDIIDLDREIEDSQSKLATILSAAEMEQRARDIGFQLVGQDQLRYMKIPGYSGRQPAVLAPYTRRSVAPAKVMPAEYTESLFDWLYRKAGQIKIYVRGSLDREGQ